jgi:hypothetical protein
MLATLYKNKPRPQLSPHLSFNMPDTRFQWPSGGGWFSTPVSILSVYLHPNTHRIMQSNETCDRGGTCTTRPRMVHSILPPTKQTYNKTALPVWLPDRGI